MSSRRPKQVQRRPDLSTGLLLVGALLLVGCHSRPIVHGLDARVQDRGEQAIQIGIDLQLLNPTDEPLKLSEFTYSVATSGRTVYRGRRAARITIDRRGDRLVTVPAVVLYDEAGWTDGPPATFDYSISGTLRYVLPGALNRTLVDMGLRRPEVGFNTRGTVDAGPYASMTSRDVGVDR